MNLKNWLKHLNYNEPFFDSNFHHFEALQLKRAEISNDWVTLVNNCLLDQFSLAFQEIFNKILF